MFKFIRIVPAVYGRFSRSRLARDAVLHSTFVGGIDKVGAQHRAAAFTDYRTKPHNLRQQRGIEHEPKAKAGEEADPTPRARLL